MACFLAPAAAAIIATAIKKKTPAHWHFDWLAMMLWGGVLMLIVDHLATGEVVLYFPFFTRSWSEILPEVVSVGIPMTLVIFAAWGIMVFAASHPKQLSIKA